MKNGMMKYSVFALSCTLAINAHAIGNGFYLGLMMGPAMHNAPTLQATVIPSTPTTASGPAGETPIFFKANPRANIFGVRVFLGNQFNQFAAIEAGGTFISSIRYNVPGIPPGFRVYGSTDQRVRDIDLVLKGILPIRWFSVYGKIGVAATYLTSGGTFNPVFKTLTPPPAPPISPTKLTVGSVNKFKWSPTFSIGASYDINQSWVTDLSMNVISVGNNIGNITFYALGLSYHFTEKYCGQFLCDD